MFHTSMEMPVRHPLRISILAILEGLQSVMLLIGLLAVIVVASSSGTITIEGYPIFQGDVSIGSSLLFAWGLWRLVPWAYWATVILQVIGLINGVIAFTRAPTHVAFIVVGMINPVVMLLYLLVNAKVRAAFRT